MCVCVSVYVRVFSSACPCVCVCVRGHVSPHVTQCLRLEVLGQVPSMRLHSCATISSLCWSVNPCVGGAVKNNNVHVYVYLDIFSRGAPFLVFLHVAMSRMFPLQNARYLANNYGRLG